MIRYTASLFAFLCLGLFVWSCDDDDAPVVTSDLITIEEFIAQNNVEIDTVLPSGLQLIRTVQGDSTFPTRNSTVTVRYRGYRTDGLIFDQRLNAEGVTFGLAGLIEGWQQGIPLIDKGGQGTLFIPYELAYGSSGTRDGVIPPNTDIIFDIEVLDFR